MRFAEENIVCFFFMVQDVFVSAWNVRAYSAVIHGPVLLHAVSAMGTRSLAPSPLPCALFDCGYRLNFRRTRKEILLSLVVLDLLIFAIFRKSKSDIFLAAILYIERARKLFVVRIYVHIIYIIICCA